MHFSYLAHTPVIPLALISVLGFILCCSPGSRQDYTPVTKSLELPENAVKNLSDAIKIPTISHDEMVQNEGITLKFLEFHELLEERYPLVHSVMNIEKVNEFSLIYEWHGTQLTDKNPVLLLAHMDVVPADDSANWTHPPFSGAIDSGFVWGRGALDDKGSIIGIMEAAELLIKEGHTPARSVFFAFGHDEEIGGNNGALEIARHFEERRIRFEYSLDEGGLIGKNMVPGMKPPVALIGIAEKGYLSLELLVRTRGGHSSMPPDENSLVIISEAITRLHNNPFPARITEPVDIFLDHTGPEQSFFNRLIIKNRWLFNWLIIRSYIASPSGNATVRTTTAPAIFHSGNKDNVIPSESRAVVNFRLLPGTSREDVIDHVTRIIDDDRIRISQYANYVPPSPVASHKSDGFIQIQDLAREHFDSIAVAPYLVIAGTDSRHYTKVTGDSYRFLPIQIESSDLDRLHGTDERISIENFQAMISFYYHFLSNH